MVAANDPTPNSPSCPQCGSSELLTIDGEERCENCGYRFGKSRIPLKRPPQRITEAQLRANYCDQLEELQQKLADPSNYVDKPLHRDRDAADIEFQKMKIEMIDLRARLNAIPPPPEEADAIRKRLDAWPLVFDATWNYLRKLYQAADKAAAKVASALENRTKETGNKTESKDSKDKLRERATPIIRDNPEIAAKDLRQSLNVEKNQLSDVEITRLKKKLEYPPARVKFHPAEKV